MAKQSIALLENTHDWPKGVQEEIDFIASLDGDDSSISGDDMFMAPNALCGSGSSNTLTGQIICDGKDNWTTNALWCAISRLELLKMEFSATNKVHWHLDKETELVGGDKKRQAYEILKEIKQRYVQRLAQTPDISNQDKVKLVYQVLREMGFTFKVQEDVLFTDNLISQGLDCDTSSFVVKALAEEFGWPVHLISVPRHVFVQWDDGKEIFNIDVGYILSDDYYIKEYSLDGDISRYETPYEAVVYSNLGLAKFRKGDWDGAIDAYKGALRLEPRCADALLGLGLAKFRKGDWDGEIDAYKEALVINPRYANAWYGLGIAKSEKGDLDGAIEAYKEALVINPRYANAWHGLGSAKFKKGDWDGAIEAYNQALDINPRDADALHGLGIAKSEKGDLDGAIEAYNQALVINPRDANAWYGLGIAKFKKGDLDGAIDAYTGALRLEPRYADALHGLGLAKKKKGDLDGAIEAYEEALRINPKLAETWYNLGLAKKKKGDWEGAEKALQEAKKLNPSLFNK